MPNYIFLSFLAAVISAFLVIYQKLVSKYMVKKVPLFLFYFYLALIFFIPAFLLVFDIDLPGRALTYLIIHSICFFLANNFLYYAIFNLDVSIVGPLLPLKLVFVPFVAYFMLGENFPLQVYLFILGIILGGFLVALDKKFDPLSFFKKPVFLLILSSLLFSIADSLVSKASFYIDSLSIQFWQIVFLFILGFFLLPFILFKENLLKEKFKYKEFFLIVGIVALFLLFEILLFLAFRENITISNSIGMLNAPLTLILVLLIGRIKPEYLEKNSLKVYFVRIVGSLIMYGSAVGLVLNL